MTALVEQMNKLNAKNKTNGSSLCEAGHYGRESVQHRFVTEPVLNQWPEEFDAFKPCAVVNTTAKQAAKAMSRFPDRVRRHHGGAGSSLQSFLLHPINLDAGTEWVQQGLAVELAQAVDVPGTGLPDFYVLFGAGQREPLSKRV
ncbi:hypothetical protein CYMTET_36844 [Cymbomonas tetramitiformis]|uniref:Uncharacterized protein n=1 Tax=Cymbomonas tetramitiformis TaxID=36881 RepID=A0AAE0CGE6_9CHLO|nr:hypothetical protein CYMTET_36844 [Cymbomonas tetramitiformis]